MTIEKVLRWTVLAGVFVLPFIPLIVTQNLFFPFITGKNFTFRIIVEIITAAWLSLALVRPEYRPKRSWMLAAFAIFIFVIGLADIFGENPFKAIWSNFERMEGWVTLAHLFAYFVVVSSTLTAEKLWARLAYTSIGVSVLMGLYGLIQLAGFITINQGGDRLDATLGNATYLAVYMVFHLFIAALLWAKNWENGNRKIWIGITHGVIILLQSFILIMTATRGAVLGTVLGATVAAVLLVLLARHSRVAWRVGAGIVAASIVIVGGFYFLKDQPFIASSGPLERLASISLESPTVKARFLNWKMAFQGVKERPILGWGQEGYNFVFNKYYDPRMYAQEPWFDRVHNIVFDWLIAGGILGFLSYISLWLVALWFLWGFKAFSISERSIFTGLLAAYGFHNLFVFDNIVSYLLFVSVLAYITVRVTREVGAQEMIGRVFIPIRALPVVAVVAVLLLWGTAWAVNWDALAANRALLQAVSSQEEGVMKNLELFQKAIDYKSLGTQEAREHLTQGASRIVQNPEVPADIQQIFYETANQELELQMKSVPSDARFPLFLGVLAGGYGAYTDAEGYLARARELSPNKQTIIFQQGLNAFALGNKEVGLNFFKEAFELEPNFDEARVLYIVAAIKTDKDTLADEMLAELSESKLLVDARILQAYIERGRADKVVSLWETHLKTYPDNIQGYFSLSAAYYALGQYSRAIRALESAIEVNPAIEGQARQFIDQIKNGTAQLE